MDFYRETAEALWRDIAGRSGFGKTAEKIDDEVRESILTVWSRILFEQDLRRFLEGRKMPEPLATQMMIAAGAVMEDD